MRRLKIKYRRLRDPDTRLIWDSPYLKHDHTTFVGWQNENMNVHERAWALPPLARWCRQQFGRRGDHRNWNQFKGSFCFREEKMAFAFVMRWNGANPEEIK